jgi:NTP pyrophosphatase (non-canonical NTP hydrolase)
MGRHQDCHRLRRFFIIMTLTKKMKKAEAALSDAVTLPELQTFIAALVDKKGWSKDPNEIFVLLTEEVGEVAKEIRRTWKQGAVAVRPSLAAELADVLFYVANLASIHGIDLAKAVRDKAAFNETRTHFGA